MCMCACCALDIKLYARAENPTSIVNGQSIKYRILFFKKILKGPEGIQK